MSVTTAMRRRMAAHHDTRCDSTKTDRSPTGPACGSPQVVFGSRAAGQLFQTWNSETCPAGHPVLAVMFARTYRAVVALNVMITVLLAFGSKVYPAEPTMVEKFEPSVDPSSDRVSVRAPQAVEGGSLRVTLPML